jgi:hypothetical protein
MRFVVYRALYCKVPRTVETTAKIPSVNEVHEHPLPLLQEEASKTLAGDHCRSLGVYNVNPMGIDIISYPFEEHDSVQSQLLMILYDLLQTQPKKKKNGKICPKLALTGVGDHVTFVIVTYIYSRI